MRYSHQRAERHEIAPRSSSMLALRRSSTESRAVLTELRRHAIAGVCCFVALVLFALSAEPELRAFVSHNPTEALKLLLGAFTSFVPIIICVAVGSLERGEQKPPRLLDDIGDGD